VSLLGAAAAIGVVVWSTRTGRRALVPVVAVAATLAVAPVPVAYVRENGMSTALERIAEGP